MKWASSSYFLFNIYYINPLVRVHKRVIVVILFVCWFVCVSRSDLELLTINH